MESTERFYELAAGHGYPSALLDVDDYASILEACQLSNVQRVLDVGCGAGAFLKDVPSGVSAIGVDALMLNLRTASRYSPVAAANGESLPFADHTFDLVVFVKSLSLMNRTLALSEAYRVLVPAGRLCIAEQRDGFWDRTLSAIRYRLGLSDLHSPVASHGNQGPLEESVGEEQHLKLSLHGVRHLETRIVRVRSSYISPDQLIDRMIFYSPITRLIDQIPASATDIRRIVSEVIFDLDWTDTALCNDYEVFLAETQP